MMIYVAQIGTTPIAAVETDTLEEAQDIFYHPSFKQDVLTFGYDAAGMTVRTARVEEELRYVSARAKAREEGEAESGEDADPYLVFLALVSEPEHGRRKRRRKIAG